VTPLTGYPQRFHRIVPAATAASGGVSILLCKRPGFVFGDGCAREGAASLASLPQVTKSADFPFCSLVGEGSGTGGRANQFRAGVASAGVRRLSRRTLTPTTTLEGHFLSDSPRFQQINPVLCGYYTESESDGETTQPAQVRSLLEQICKTEGRLKAR